ncbi:MAG: hypothetical protein QM501_08625, partial [Gimesia sp.]
AAYIDKQSLSKRKRPVIVVADRFQRNSKSCLFPHIRACLLPEDYGQEIGKMLIRQVNGEAKESMFCNVDVEMVQP